MTKIHTCRDIPDELVEVLKTDGIAMVDCEFTGLDVGKKGTDRLCLIQICNKESKEVYLVQPNKNFETPNLVKVLNDPNIQNSSTFDDGIILEGEFDDVTTNTEKKSLIP